MRRSFYILQLVSLFVFILLPYSAEAHQPRIVTEQTTVVTEPEISKAYYAQLDGESQVYAIDSAVPFNLYVNVLVPDIAGQKKDVSAFIVKDVPPGMGTAGASQVATLDGTNVEWKKFFEPFGHDTYWQGPEYRARVEAGHYEIHVVSPQNDSKYSLAVGEIESFDLKETINTLITIPLLKKNFFNKSPADFIWSPIGSGYVVLVFMFAFLCGFVLRIISRRFAHGTARAAVRNINIQDRVFRVAIGVVLFGIAISTTWNVVLLFLAGFCFFEAVFSWCVYNYVRGKNTC